MPPRQTAPKKSSKAPRKATSSKKSAAEEEHAPDSSPLPPLPPSDDEVALLPIQSPIPDKKKRKAPAHRSPLPARAKRVKQPGKPDQPRAKRTHEQVEADNKEIAALKADIAQLHEERLEALARMEVAQDASEKGAAEATVMFKSRGGTKKDKPVVGATFGRREQEQELDSQDSDGPFLEFDDDDFNAVAEADERIRRALKAEKLARAKEADRYNLDKLPPIAPLPAKVSKTRQKGAGRAAVEQAKEKLLSHKRFLSGDESDLEVPKKKLKAAFPTGVAKDWRNKVTAVGTTKKQGAKAAGDSIGGLADDDLDDLRPIGFGRNKSTIEILSDSEDETPTKPQHRPIHARKDVPIKSEGKPQLKHAAPKAKAEASMAVDSEVAGLPEFARAAWCTQLSLPFITTSELVQLGWEICELGEEVKVVQLVFDIVFPGNSYKVKKGCPIYVTAMARLSDKRHLIGSQTVKLVDAFFDTVEYINKPKKIAKYANWAIDDNGPAWYERPTPRGLVHGVPGFIPTHRIREVDVKVQRRLRQSLHSRRRDDLCGARACFQPAHNGVKVLNGPFSKGKVGEYVIDFTKAARRLEAWRWNKIMTACVTQIQEEDGHLISASAAMNVDRGTMVLGSSPVKGSDEDEVD
ncbi:hypothetical protein B0H13DRAFT_2471868 [Mycena leptocephala]|nr:hypothetical protein B0H13DRAFT_2471868 [Mycena leptocephala]